MKKILLDENMPALLAQDFSDVFEVKTVPEMGWAGKKNGELLEAMTEEQFDVLLTVDKNLRFQQNLDKYNIQVAVILTYDNRYKTLKEHIVKIEEAIAISADKVVEIDLK